jgi:alpha-galactosidase
MKKITFIGAGSMVFADNLLTDILTFPSFQNDTLICLEDIDPGRLDTTYRYIKKMVEDNSHILNNVEVEKTTKQKEAIENAKYIINAIQVGWLDVMKYDFEIPLKYGVSQCVGDTLGPGGIFRFLRTVPAIKSIIEDIQEFGYNTKNNSDKPLLLNYSNPMAMNTWYCNKLLPDSTVGLCHGVQSTAGILRKVLKVPEENFDYFCAGINHMAWFLKVWYRKDKNSPWQDANPELKRKMKDNTKYSETDKVRRDMFNACGYYMTESSGHLSEYLPYYRKRKDLLEKYKAIKGLYAHLEHGAYYDMCVNTEGWAERNFEKRIKEPVLNLKKKPSTEFASHILNAMETDKPFGFNGNVINKEQSLITNLPEGCCVEVPVFADIQGLHPQGGIELPTICQALCISNVLVQKATVEGALELDREKIFHAVMLDPNTASVCSPQEIRDMVDEMFEKEAKWLPKFN